jgi:hypothetical protein
MYKVAGHNNMMDSYYGDERAVKKSGLEMPHVTVNNHRMTNVQLSGGEVIQGIRRNNDLGLDGSPQKPAFECPNPVRPLRYTPGLKCDSALEALRPEREMKHQPLQGGDQWRRKLIQVPSTYDGSFADADMQQFRPYPNPNPMEDPWYCSRLPDQGMSQGIPQVPQGGMELGPYSTAYPQDELSRIKMRNRRFQQSCAMDGMHGGFCPAPGPAPAWRGPVLTPPAAPAITEDMMMGGYEMQDDLAMLDQELNMTRRATRPFVPTNDSGYFDLQRQVNLLANMPTVPVRRPRMEEPMGTDQLVAPKKIEKRSEVEAPKQAGRQQVRIADQIAIRSYVLGKGLGATAAQ